MEKYSMLASTEEDIADLVGLINLAYRGGPKAGWTSEERYLDGSRTDETMVAELQQQPNAVMLKWVDETGRLVGCVHLALEDGHLHLGTFAILPEIQAQGLGRSILDGANEYAREKGCDKIVITVVSARDELIEWYVRRGFVRTGRRIPFPAKWGITKFAVDFVEMERIVS